MAKIISDKYKIIISKIARNDSDEQISEEVLLAIIEALQDVSNRLGVIVEID